MRVALCPDGELVIAANGLSIGGSDPGSAQLVRVSRDGAVTSAVAFDAEDLLPIGVKADNCERPFVVLGFPRHDYQVIAFDAADSPRWRKHVLGSPMDWTAMFDVARDGMVVVAQLETSGASSVRALNGDGSERWTVPSPGLSIFFVAALDTGTVAVTTASTFNLDAADGHTVATSPLVGQATWRQTRHDGTTAAKDNHAEHFGDIVLFEPSGAERWRNTGIEIGRCPSRNFCPDPPLYWSEYVVLAPDDRVLVVNEVTKITLLAAETGDEIATVDHGDAPGLFGADADGYVVLERRDTGELALSRYPYPH